MLAPDIWMVAGDALREVFALALESRESFGVRRGRIGQNLDGYLAAERGVGGPPHLPHPALANRRGDFVDADAGAGGERQVWR